MYQSVGYVDVGYVESRDGNGVWGEDVKIT